MISPMNVVMVHFLGQKKKFVLVVSTSIFYCLHGECWRQRTEQRVGDPALRCIQKLSQTWWEDPRRTR